MAETKVSVKLELDTSEAMKKIDELVSKMNTITEIKTTEIEPIKISFKEGVNLEEVLETMRRIKSNIEIPKENDMPEFKKSEYKDLLIKERIKKYPEKALSKILNLECDFEDKFDNISEIKMTLEKLSLS